MTALRVLHIVPCDITRGAQVYARMLRETLDEAPSTHRTMSLFRTPPAALAPDFTLDVPLTWRRRCGVDPIVVRKLRHFLRTWCPHVLVAHGGESLKYVAFARQKQTVAVYYKIGMSAQDLRGFARRALYRACIRRMDALVTVSEETRTELERLFGVSRSDVKVIPNARDADTYCPRSDTRISVVRSESDADARETVQIVTVGQLVKEKRPALFLAVVRALRDEGLPVTGIMVGEGPLLRELSPLAEKAGVSLLGRREDVPALLAASDIFLFTSETEGLPGVLLEAGLSGLACVTTEVPGAHEIVAHKVTGFVVEKDDFSGLVNSAAQLVCDAGLRRRFGAAARTRCREKFSFDMVAAAWNALFADIVEDKADDMVGVSAVFAAAAGQESFSEEGVEVETKSDQAAADETADETADEAAGGEAERAGKRRAQGRDGKAGPVETSCDFSVFDEDVRLRVRETSRRCTGGVLYVAGAPPRTNVLRVAGSAVTLFEYLDGSKTLGEVLQEAARVFHVDNDIVCPVLRDLVAQLVACDLVVQG